MFDFALNLRRLMARSGLTLDEVVESTGLNRRTVKAILSGATRPHARTLHRLARGLNVPADELFQNPSLLTHRLFDQRTNPAVEEFVQAHPDMFHGWKESDYEELYSRFGIGGALAEYSTQEVVVAMNRKREVQQKVALLLETGEARLLASLVDVLYQRVLVNSE